MDKNSVKTPRKGVWERINHFLPVPTTILHLEGVDATCAVSEMSWPFSYPSLMRMWCRNQIVGS